VTDRKHIAGALNWIAGFFIVLVAGCGNGDLTVMRQVDRDFILKASEINLTEIALAELAAVNANTPAVRSFAEIMLAENETALEDLRSIADDKNAAITQSINLEHQKLLERLTIISGYPFDTAYMNAQVMIHEKTFQLYESQISGGSDPVIVRHAIAYLPDIKRYYQIADSIFSVIQQ
jgi:putative membrane protein